MYIKKQEGAALIVALVCLIMVSMMGVLSMKTANTSAKISANAKQSAQAMRMVESSLTSFFINPAALWNLETIIGPPTLLRSAVLGNAAVPMQATYTHDDTCPIAIGEHREDGSSDGGSCAFFRITGHYEVNALTDATASAGFHVKLKTEN